MNHIWDKRDVKNNHKEYFLVKRLNCYKLNVVVFKKWNRTEEGEKQAKELFLCLREV